MIDESPHNLDPVDPHIEKKRLLFLVTEFYYFKSHKINVATTAMENGFDVTVAARLTDDSSENYDFQVINLNWNRSGSLLSSALQFLPELYRVRKAIKKTKPDILHNIALKPSIIGSLAAMGTNTKVINSINGLGFVFYSKSVFARIAQGVCGLVMRLSVRANNARIVLQNRDDKNLAYERMGIPHTHLRLIAGSGVDTNHFNFSPEPSEHPFKFLILARLLYIKGVQIAVAAHKILREQGFEQELIICGERDTGNPSAIPANIIAQWSKIPGIKLNGQVEDVRSQISSSHVVVHPALGGEGLPKALLEAAGSARALIASDVSGNREIVIPGETGLLVPPDNPEALAGAMRRTMEQPAERRRWANAARAKAEAEFSLPQVLDQHAALYREFLPAPS